LLSPPPGEAGLAEEIEENAMQGNIATLVVSSHPEEIISLIAGLERLGATVRVARCVAEANALLASPEPPLLIFSEVTLEDGVWEDLLAWTRRSANPVHMIVVSRQPDVDLYVRTINQGAFDFVVAPITLSDLAYVFRGAADSALRLRNGEPRPVAASARKPRTAASAPLPEPPKKRIEPSHPRTLPPLAYHSAE
jgi:DNA-binding NtrC family response regulator